MKKLILIISLVSLLISCNKDTNMKGSVELTDLIPGAQNLTLTVHTKNINSISYCIYESDLPNNDLIRISPSGEENLVIPGLKPATEYVIKFVAEDKNDKEIIREQKFETLEAYSFAKKTVIHKFTGTWCKFCPSMTSAIEELATENPNKFYLIAVHCGNDPLKTNFAESLCSKFSITGYPTALFDYTYKTQNARKEELESKLETCFEKIPATSGISITSEITGDVLSVDVKVDFTDKGNYRICCALLEDNINIPNTVGSKDGYYHHVLRDLATSDMGNVIGKKLAGESYNKKYNFNIQEGWNKDNLSIIVYTLAENKNYKFYINNANTAKIGESVKPEIIQ